MNTSTMQITFHLKVERDLFIKHQFKIIKYITQYN